MGKYKRYKEYKDSGAEWSNDIPKSWETLKVGSFFKASKGKNAALLTKEYCANNSGQYPVYSGQTANGGIMGTLNRYEIDAGIEGVLFITSVGEKAMSNRLIKGKFSLSQNCMIVRTTSQQLSVQYYNYQFQILLSHERSNIPQDMQPSFRIGDFYKYKFVLPPLETQHKIVEFLDKETAHIDAGISHMESLVSLLTEKRSALISETVTRGIPGEHTEFKDSGVEWLGEIPVGWDVVRFGSLFNRVKSLGTGKEELLSVYRDHGVVPKSSRNDNHNVASEDLSKYQIVKKNNLVINKMKAWQGSVAISPYDGIVSPAYFVFEPSKANNHNLKFLHYLMRSANFRGFYHSISKGIRLGQWDLDQKSHKSMPVLLPSIDEQEAIVQYIELEMEKIHSLTSIIEETLSVLKEKRQKLISDVVTGKICVE
jgi:type I restriction enzyme S subunit